MTVGGARRILAVTDLGPVGALAVAEAGVRATAHGESLAVVHVMPSLEMVRPLFADRVAEDALRQAMLPKQLRDALERQVSDHGGTAADSATLFLEAGGTAGVALEVAERWEADLVVIGVDATEIVDTERIVRHARVPVLVVRAGRPQGPVVACTDFSDPALPAVREAAAEARRVGAPLHVLHVVEPLPSILMGIEGFGIIHASKWRAARRADAERRLAAVFAAQELAGQYTALEGPAVASLVGAASTFDARLLVVGTVGRTGLTQFLLGSVAEALVRGAPCSTLVVRGAG